MTTEQRQALREKHQALKIKPQWCAGCGNAYPCDAIKILNAWEKSV